MAVAVALPRAQIKDLGALITQFAAAANDLPRVEFDPGARADALGRDPQRIFEWVRDQTWWAPYRGLLRGSKGVMLDRVGSNLDRAVLLADLLRRAGHTVRLARARLPEDQARGLLARVRPMPERRRAAPDPKPLSTDRERALEAIIPGLHNASLAMAADTRRRSEEADALARSQAADLIAVIDNAGMKTGADDSGVALAAIQDHWWVERHDNGKWVALDVLPPDAKVGDAQTAVAEISEWKTGTEAPPVAAEEWHVVKIRVVVERYRAGVTTEAEVLNASLRPVDVLERPVALVHVPLPWPDALHGARLDPKAVREAALKITQWVPALLVGKDLIGHAGFTDKGNVKSNPLDLGGGSGGAGGLFGGMESALGGGDEGEGFATAEWIDFEIQVPGTPSQRIRRPVFDLIGPGRRATKAAGFDPNTETLRLQRADALWSRLDILLQPCEFTTEFTAHLASASLVANQQAFMDLAKEADPAKAKRRGAELLAELDMWSPLPDLAVWRSELGGRSGDWFIDRPNILTYRVANTLPAVDRLLVTELTDIAANTIGVSRSAKGPFQTRVAQGVADTVAEVLTLGGNIRGSENTASVFALAAPTRDHAVLIKSRADVGASGPGWSSDVAARLSEDVGAGFLVVILKRPVLLAARERLGWWRIDPASGETIGVMDTGFRQATISRATLATLTGVFTMWLTKFDPQTAARMYQRANGVSYQTALTIVYKMRDKLFQAICEVAGF